MERKNGQHHHSSGLWRSLRDGDFEEADVWDVLGDKHDRSTNFCACNEPAKSLSRPILKYTPAKMIPEGSNSSSSSSSGSTPEPRIFQRSAPVNVPDWPDIHRPRTKPKKASDHVSLVSDDENVSDDEDDENEYDCKLPPHEFIASRLARSHISTFSVFEGVGRTLKGRDLSKVRNAVLLKTGFLESP